MRIALTMALAMVAATAAWANEPSAPDAKSETAAQAAADQPAAPAQANSTEATAKAAEPAEAEKPFKPPTGYRAKRVNGSDVYCTKVVVLGSRFPKEDCRTEAQLRDMEAQKASMRGEMDQKKMICSGAGACGGD